MTKEQEGLFEDSKGLVFYCINRFNAKCESLTREDLEQEGYLGLIYAIEHYDPQQDTLFSTYAVHCINGFLLHAAYHDRLIHIPTYMLNMIINGEKDITTDAELQNVFSPHMSFDTHQIFSDGDDSDLTLADAIASDGEDRLLAFVGMTSLQKDLKKALDVLNDKEKEVILSRYGFINDTPQTLQTIGDRMGVTRERVRQIEDKALKKLYGSKKAQKLKPYLEMFDSVGEYARI